MGAVSLRSHADLGAGRKPPRFRPASTAQGTLIKVVLLGLANGLGVYGLQVTATAAAWGGFAAIAVSTVAIDVIYLSKRTVPLKYLLPGTLLLVVFQLWPVTYNTYIAFTNYGAAHNLSKTQAIERIEAANLLPASAEDRYRAVAATADDTLGLILVDSDGTVLVVAPGQDVRAVDDTAVVRDGDRITAAAEFQALTLAEAAQRQEELSQFSIPVDGGAIRLQTLTTAAVQKAAIQHDPDSGIMVDVRDSTVYHPRDGRFVAESGAVLQPGWRTAVGFDNFRDVFTSQAIRGPFLRVFVWTFAFALLSVLLTFVVGLGLAVVLHKPTMRFRRTYRSLLILPYALPSFMTALIWAGLLNTRFGAVNRVLGLPIDWLGDPMLAKASTLLVNTWLGFPYMFLVSLGALQSIPSELLEAAHIDGASGWKAFRLVTLPLLLVAISPLLIASFAFNFNNFNVIYLLTGGGPPIAGAQTPAGHTDILISYTYRLAFAGGQGADFGLASAVSVLIFLFVAIVSVISFRRTRAFEEVN